MTGRRVIVWQNQGLLGIAFFKATAFFILLPLFVLLRRDHKFSYFRIWLAGWACLTISSWAELISIYQAPGLSHLRYVIVGGQFAALLLFLIAVIRYTSGSTQLVGPMLPLAGVMVCVILYLEYAQHGYNGWLRWGTAGLQSLIFLCAGWLLWRCASSSRGIGAKLLAGAFLVSGLHGLDRPQWPDHPFYLFRVAFDQMLCVALGTAMGVLVLEGAKLRTEELNDKLRRLTLLTTASTQTLSVQDVLDKVLSNLVESLGATHGAVRLLDGEGQAAELVLRSTVGFSQAINEKYARVSILDPWVQRVLKERFVVQTVEEKNDEAIRRRMIEAGLTQVVTLPLPGKEGPLGIVAVGSTHAVKFQEDEISYMMNVANLLGLTLQNVDLFEQVSAVQQQWAYTFDSIGDPVLVHDREFRIVRSNQRIAHLLGRQGAAMDGRTMGEVFFRKNARFENCPYCEGIAGDGDDPDPWLPGYFLASNAAFAGPEGRPLGTVHFLKDITERKRAEEKYRTLISNVQEGVFISTPQGRFLDFNEAFMQIAGYESREELLAASIPSFYVRPADRERLRRLLQEHGSVSDFEFEIYRKDGEVRTVLESSTTVRDAAGNVTAYQGFLLDITERKRAEQEIRRRNRELLVLNSISQTLSESLDLTASLHRALRQLQELFHLDACSLFLFEGKETILRRVAAVGHESEYAREFPPIPVQAELLQHIRAVRATFLSAQGLSLPRVFRDAQVKERLVTAYIVVLWSKDRVIGGLSVGCRSVREFSPADVNLLIAVGSQLASAIDRSRLFEETKQAYDNLRRTQEQLLHSEKMAAVGQLISGVAHELNNPLTAILGYSQLLTSSGQVGTQAVEYAEKLYKQAQRTHRIVQNLLSFARQHKPERVPVQFNQVVEDTLALRDYDLRMSNIRLHLDLARDLPVTAADPHQLQQVFLNLVNNAVDAILEYSKEGDIWVRTGVEGEQLLVEFTDSGPGVQDPSRVFDPFYTTKPVGKGTGLGLSICYGIITEHGGRIHVRNTPPRGATFTIEIPFQPAGGMEKPSTAQPVAAARGGRILFVDADESVLEAVGDMLRARDYIVQTSQSAEHAREILGQAEFDLILADMHLREKQNARRFCEWLRAEKPEAAKRLVLMRSAAPVAGTEAEPESPIGRVLQKPFKNAELIAAVEEVLGQIHSASVAR